MSIRAKVVDDAFWEIIKQWQKSPDRPALEEILTRVFDAGRLEAPDRECSEANHKAAA